MNRYSDLYGALRDLPDTGPEGFEGFVFAALQAFVPELSILFLAKSGYQRGVDASSGGQGSTWAGLECKHYEPGKSAPVRELAGGLALAINGSGDQLDAWLLVTTGAVGALDAAELRQAANREAVGLVIIDWQQAGLPILGVLCAAAPAETMRELKSRLPNLRVEPIHADLETITRDPAFSSRRDELRRILSAAEMGFDQARNAANGWIAESIASSTEARATLGQPLCPLDESFANWIDRPAVTAEIDMWYREWTSSHSLGILVGREGVGKSWVTLKWWSSLVSQPLTLLVTSNTAAAGADALDLMADQLIRQTGMGERRMWRRRLERWLRATDRSRPEILLIFDGLNERPRHDWVSDISEFRRRYTVSHVAVLVTCWTSYWFSRVGPRLPEDLSVRLIEVPSFSDPELRDALHSAGQAFDTVPGRIREFLRVPRVFSIAVGYLNELRSGALTVERLLVTDWRNRRRTEYGIVHTEEEFRGIVLGLAREIRGGGPTFAIRTLRAHSSLAQGSPDRDLDRDFTEFVESDLFETDPSGDGEFRVKQEHTGLVLGMLLADEIRRAKDETATDLDAKVERAVEVVSGFSEASDIMRGSIAAACNWGSYPDSALQALLRGWLRLRNRPEEHLNDFGAYLPDRTEAYLGIADEIWCNSDRYTYSREWIISAILANLARDAVFRSVRDYANKWLSYWHQAWHPFLGRADQEWSAAHLLQVRAALDDASITERKLIGRDLIVPPDERYPSTAELALVVASQGGRVPFVPGLSGWALSRAVMNLPVDAMMIAWCLRLNRIDAVETESQILAAADRLAAAGSIGRAAAVLLLEASGTNTCADRLSALGASWPTQQVVQRAFPVSAPGVGTPDITRFLARLAEIGPNDIWSQMAATVIDQDLEDMEPAIAAFAPRDAAGFVRCVLRTASQRNQLPLRQLSWNAPAHSLLVGVEELDAFDDALNRLLPELEGRLSRDALFIESQLTLALLPAVEPEQRFQRIVSRPEAAYLLRSLEPILGGLSPDRCNVHLISAVNEGGLAHLRAALWFLSCQDFELSEAARPALVSCFTHQDQLVRTCAFRLASRSEDPLILASIRQGPWACEENPSGSLEGLYGSRAICLSAGAGDYTVLRARITPQLWGLLAERDGSDVAIDAFGDDLDLLLRGLLAKTVSDPRRDPAIMLTLDSAGSVEPQEVRIDPFSPENGQSLDRVSFSPESTVASVNQLAELLDPDGLNRRAQQAMTTVEGLYERARRAGAAMFGCYFQAHSLAGVIRRRPQLIDSWLALLEGEGVEEVVWHAGDFYRALAQSLAPVDPGRAALIIRRLRGNRRGTRVVAEPMKIDALTYAAWEIPDCAEARQLRTQILDGALTDKSLFDITLVAQHPGAKDNLIRVIEEDVASGILAFEARALTLIGWLDRGPAHDRLVPLLSNRRGYLGEVARTARERLRRNWLARAWFSEFLSRRDPKTSWAAFRMTLRCADRRLYLWASEMRNAVVDLPDRWRLALAAAESDIANAIDSNERGLDDLLFGTKIGSSGILSRFGRT